MKLLAAIDIHQDPKSTVEAAAAWAEATHSTVHLVYVDTSLPAGDELPPSVDSGPVLVLETKLQALSWNIPKAHRGPVRVVGGPPAEALLRIADQYDAILINTRGRKGLGRMMLGSVADTLVRTSPIPVITLRSR